MVGCSVCRFISVTWFPLGRKIQGKYGFFYEFQLTVHQILVSEEVIYVKCLYITNKMIYLKPLRNG
uniref:Uncharacterized protein n=1 Tax=Paramormyrops kingsleyae TaxID=1676925 RepID=A0A3B3S0H2_9TELE